MRLDFCDTWYPGTQGHPSANLSAENGPVSFSCWMSQRMCLHLDFDVFIHIIFELVDFVFIMINKVDGGNDLLQVPSHRETAGELEQRHIQVVRASQTAQ